MSVAYKKQTKRQSNNASGKVKSYPPEIAKLRQSFTDQFKREADEAGIHGKQREQMRKKFMYNNFYSKLRPAKIYTQVGIAVSQIAQEALSTGHEPIDVLREIIKYAANND